MEIIFILFAYMFGSIPTAYIIAKRFARLNILHVGSGNSGASNLMFQTNFFVGISGGNYGLAGCFNDPGEYVCNGKTG